MRNTPLRILAYVHHRYAPLEVLAHADFPTPWLTQTLRSQKLESVGNIGVPVLAGPIPDNGTGKIDGVKLFSHLPTGTYQAALPQSLSEFALDSEMILVSVSGFRSWSPDVILLVGVFRLGLNEKLCTVLTVLR